VLYNIRFTRSGLTGEITRPYTGRESGAKAFATRIQRDLFGRGPWEIRLVESRTGKLVASRIGQNPWSHAQ
jgi:hypothetical protein